MSITMHRISAPIFARHLKGLANCMTRTQALYAEKKYDESSLLNYRFYPDMFHFTMQVQMAIFHSTGCMANLAGVDAPRFDGQPESLGDLIDRVNKTIEFIESISPEQVDDKEDQDITIRMRDREMTMKGYELVQDRALPNFYFHCTTAYDIMRHNGVEIGKRDFMGN